MSRPTILSDIDELQSKATQLEGSIDELEESINSQTADIQSALEDIYTLKSAIQDLNYQIDNLLINTTVGSLDVGDEFYLKEQGALVAFILVHKNYITTGNIVAIRKHPLPLKQYHKNELISAYNASDLCTYLDSVYPTLLNVTLTKINLPIANVTDSNTHSISTGCFAPSRREVDGSTSVEGSRFSYFTSTSNWPATYNGVSVSYHTRTLIKYTNTLESHRILGTSVAQSGVTNQTYVRPCIVLGSGTQVHLKLDRANANIVASAALE